MRTLFLPIMYVHYSRRERTVTPWLKVSLFVSDVTAPLIVCNYSTLCKYHIGLKGEQTVKRHCLTTCNMPRSGEYASMQRECVLVCVRVWESSAMDPRQWSFSQLLHVPRWDQLRLSRRSKRPSQCDQRVLHRWIQPSHHQLRSGILCLYRYFLVASDNVASKLN